MHEELSPGKTEDDHKDVADEQHGVDAGDDLRAVLEEHGTGSEALNGERAHENGGDGVAGDAEREQRDKRAARDAVICGLSREDTLVSAFAEHLGVLGGTARLVIGEEGRDAAAGGGDNADERADSRRAEHIRDILLHFGERDELAGNLGGLYLNMIDRIDSFGNYL